MTNERIDDLQVNGLQIIQKTDGFCFGVDAVLLANYVNISKKDRIADLCTGTGVIPVILAGKRNVLKVTGVEIQPEYAEMAERSVKLNNLCERIEIICGDLRNKSLLPYEQYDVVTCNPPYKEVMGGFVSESDSIAIARHEITCKIQDVAQAAARILKYGGKLCIVHRPERLAEIFEAMKACNIEPKRGCMVQPAPEKPPNIVLVEGIKGGKPKILWDAPITIYDGDGKYTKQLNNIYGRNS